MPLFFYLPLIVWTGMIAAAGDEMRRPRRNYGAS
jgi:hypothetical protein